MTQETLKRLRLIIPGILLTVILSPLFQPTLNRKALANTFLSSDILQLSIAVLAIGALYEVLDARRFAGRSALQKINSNIKDGLVKPCPNLTKEEISSLRQGRKLMHVFYRFVDRDPSLQEKAKAVRFNGILLSSLADVATGGGLGLVVYVAAAAITERMDFLVIAGVLLLVGILAQTALMPIVTRRHIDLSNEQLEFISQQYKQDLCAELARIS